MFKMHIFFLGLLLIIVSLSGCKTSKENGNDVDDLSVDKDYDLTDSENDPELDSGGDDSDSIDDGDTKENIDNDFDEAPVDEDMTDDSDTDKVVSLCNPNPCKIENKTQCREVYNIFEDEIVSRCFCDEGWIGQSCKKCQKGYFGAACAPCDCKKNEICNDGADGDGACSCATEIVEGKCKCSSGWSGEDCEIFGANWKCNAVGEICTTTGDCCFDGICMASFLNDESVCRRKKRYGGEEIREFAVSHDSALVATSRMGAVRIHSAADFKELFRVSDTVSSSTAIAFSPDGRFLAVNESGTLNLRSMEDGTVLDSDNINYNQELQFSPDGTMLAAAYDDGFIVYKISDGSLAEYLSGAFDYIEASWNVSSVSFSPDSSLLVVGSGLSVDDKNARIYDLKTKSLLVELPVDEYYLKTSFSSQGKMMATGGYPLEYDDSVSIYKLNSGNEWKFSYSFEGLSTEIYSLSFNDSDDFLAVGCRGYTIVYSLYDKFPLLLSDGWQAEFASDDKSLIIGTESGELQKLSMPSFGDPVSSADYGNRWVQLSSGGKDAVYLKGSDRAVFAEPLTGDVINEVQLPYSAYNNNIKFSNDLKKGAFSFDKSGTRGFILADLMDDNIILEENIGVQHLFSFSPDDKVLAVWAWYSTDVLFYYTETGELLSSIEIEDQQTVSEFYFSPDGKIAGMKTKNQIRFFDTIEWEELFSLSLGKVSFFPDGSKIIVADGSINVFSAVNGSKIDYPAFDMTAKVAVISADEKYLLTDSGVYEIGTDRFIPFTTHYFGMTDVDISSGNSLLITEGRDTLRIIDATGILEPYKGECSADSDCETGFFCNIKVSRCFADIEYK